MNGSKAFLNDKYPYKLSYSKSNLNQYSKLGSHYIKNKHNNNTYNNKYNLKPVFKEKEEKKFTNSIKVNQMPPKMKSYNNLIKSYSEKKNEIYISG